MGMSSRTSTKGKVNAPDETRTSGVFSKRVDSSSSHSFSRVLVQPGASSPSVTAPAIQRAVADETAEARMPAEPLTESAAQETPAPGFIVDDEAESISPEQMRKTEFLERLRTSICATADRALSSVGRSTESCPYIEEWIGRYRSREARYVERALRKYAPETSTATTARDYIPLISDRVGRAVTVWATTGEITDVPEELASQLPGMGVLGAVSGFLSGVGSLISSVASGIAGAVSGIGSLFFKERSGGAKEPADPQTVRSQLGVGSSLDGGVRSRMESAFGHDFSRVRVHADGRAADLATNLNARAFTIGSDIAFGKGEYQPGTPVGDALVAHELAHVVQQAGSGVPTAAMPADAEHNEALEQEADLAAVDAVGSIWGRAVLGMDLMRRTAWPRVKSGLSLQRCGPKPTPKNRYQELVVEGTEKLIKPRIGFGVPWGEIGEYCGTEEGCGYFDCDYWTTVKIGETSCMLVNKEGVSAADAIESLYKEDRSDKWQIDCGMFTQIPHYYALLRTLGPDAFNKRVNNKIELKKQFSPGLKTRAYWIEGSKPGWLVEAVIREDTGQGPVMEPIAGTERFTPKIKPNAKERPEDEVLADAPVGSRVNFSAFALAGPFEQPPTIDNTIKMGDDLYAAHDVPKGKSGMYTKEEMREMLAEKYTRPKEMVRVTLVDILELQ